MNYLNLPDYIAIFKQDLKESYFPLEIINIIFDYLTYEDDKDPDYFIYNQYFTKKRYTYEKEIVRKLKYYTSHPPISIDLGACSCEFVKDEECLLNMANSIDLSRANSITIKEDEQYSYDNEIMEMMLKKISHNLVEELFILTTPEDTTIEDIAFPHLHTLKVFRLGYKLHDYLMRFIAKIENLEYLDICMGDLDDLYKYIPKSVKHLTIDISKMSIDSIDASNIDVETLTIKICEMLCFSEFEWFGEKNTTIKVDNGVKNLYIEALDKWRIIKVESQTLNILSLKNCIIEEKIPANNYEFKFGVRCRDSLEHGGNLGRYIEVMKKGILPAMSMVCIKYYLNEVKKLVETISQIFPQLNPPIIIFENRDKIFVCRIWKDIWDLESSKYYDKRVLIVFPIINNEKEIMIKQFWDKYCRNNVTNQLKSADRIIKKVRNSRLKRYIFF